MSSRDEEHEQIEETTQDEIGKLLDKFLGRSKAETPPRKPSPKPKREPEPVPEPKKLDKEWHDALRRAILADPERLPSWVLDPDHEHAQDEIDAVLAELTRTKTDVATEKIREVEAKFNDIKQWLSRHRKTLPIWVSDDRRPSKQLHVDFTHFRQELAEVNRLVKSGDYGKVLESVERAEALLAELSELEKAIVSDLRGFVEDSVKWPRGGRIVTIARIAAVAWFFFAIYLMNALFDLNDGTTVGQGAVTALVIFVGPWFVYRVVVWVLTYYEIGKMDSTLRELVYDVSRAIGEKAQTERPRKRRDKPSGKHWNKWDKHFD